MKLVLFGMKTSWVNCTTVPRGAQWSDQKKMSRVDVNETNLKHCRCPVCPVQKNSECVQEKLKQTSSPDRLNGAMLYCSIGKSQCHDLDGSEGCLCPTCLVWEQYNLDSMYYCLRGSADAVGPEHL